MRFEMRTGEKLTSKTRSPFNRRSQALFPGAMKRSAGSIAWLGPLAPTQVSHRRGILRYESQKSGLEKRGVKARKTKRSITPFSAQLETPKQQNMAEIPVTWRGEGMQTDSLVSQVRFNDAGLVPAIAQQWDTGEVLLMAWMSAESIRETMRGGRAVYYSRSRKELWRKGDTSGQIQVLRDILLDCDGDTVLLKVDQLGVACHTGRRSCFYTAFRPPSGETTIIADVIMDPKELYKSDN